MAKSTFKTRMKSYEIGDPIEVGHPNRMTHTVDWVEAIIVKPHPLTVKYQDGSVEELLPTTLRRKSDKIMEAPEPKKLSELPDDVLKELYHKALVDIIKEGTTKTPNATVRRMINIAKEALGEIPI